MYYIKTSGHSCKKETYMKKKTKSNKNNNCLLMYFCIFVSVSERKCITDSVYVRVRWCSQECITCI